ncbi:pseudouridine synthase [Chitiniphilus shinanonensis]|uniref:pseudouridine synthase n=1 Tax=Chitiniphilus shinanonensis TaxID=553088 RepID=UPI0030411EAD
MSALPLLYLDDHLVVVHKPSGLLVHRTSLDFHETRFALQLVRDQLGRRVYPVHRLDKGTSGALTFALTPEIGRALSTLFETRQVEKDYLAVVRGWPDEAGEIDHPLERRLDDAEIWGGPLPSGAQDALTRYRRLATVELPWAIDRYPSSRYALLALHPLTGRRHQLRRHLKHISHPIIGDATHGKGHHNRAFAEAFGVRRLLLANTRLAFVHPATGQPLDLRCPLADDYASVLDALGWGAHAR